MGGARKDATGPQIPAARHQDGVLLKTKKENASIGADSFLFFFFLVFRGRVLLQSRIYFLTNGNLSHGKLR